MAKRPVVEAPRDHDACSPGPGSYNVDAALLLTKSLSPARHGVIGMSPRWKRKDQDPEDLLPPGPATYAPADEALGRTVTSPRAVIGTTRRHVAEHDSGMRMPLGPVPTPGPACYNTCAGTTRAMSPRCTFGNSRRDTFEFMRGKMSSASGAASSAASDSARRAHGRHGGTSSGEAIEPGPGTYTIRNEGTRSPNATIGRSPRGLCPMSEQRVAGAKCGRGHASPRGMSPRATPHATPRLSPRLIAGSGTGGGGGYRVNID